MHIGFILDGNRRWARAHGVPVIAGHRQGYKTLQTICDAAFERGVDVVSAYVFSTENWQRDKKEVANLLKLLARVLDTEVAKVHKRNYRLRFSGSRSNVSSSLARKMAAAEELTANNTAGTIVLCFDYGGQQEIIQAVQQAVQAGAAVEALSANDITKHLYTADIPAPDLIIRTSGEQRLSNFLLWQSAYSELRFETKNWPDYTVADLENALADYQARQRRHGR